MLSPFLFSANEKGWITHEQLDQWSPDGIAGGALQPDEISLLKSFHRGFQLRGEPGLIWKPGTQGRGCSVPSFTEATRASRGTKKEQEQQRRVFENDHVSPHQVVPRTHVSPPGLRVLSLDSCGVRGLQIVQTLHELEVKSKLYCYETFDMICGTGCAALIAMAMVRFRMSAHDIRIRFREQAVRFNIPDTQFLERLDAFWPEDELKQPLKSVDSPKFCMVESENGRVFCNDSPLTVGEAIRACTHFGLKKAYMEAFGNPCTIGLRECKRFWPNENIFCVVSIGVERWKGANSDSLNREAAHAKRVHEFVSGALGNRCSYHRIVIPEQPAKDAFIVKFPVFREPEKFHLVQQDLAAASASVCREGQSLVATFKKRPVVVQRNPLGNLVKITFTDRDVIYTCTEDEYDALESEWGNLILDGLPPPKDGVIWYKHETFVRDNVDPKDIELHAAENVFG